ncbi:protein of unknown function [Candidatus Methylomirabilis oxygeniifera]|jgi:T-complex protein 1 subunit zeta
MSSV